MLKFPESRSAYWQQLKSECEKSSLISLLEKALMLPGDVIECGVFRGNSIRRIARQTKEIAPEKKIFALDSFEGFPNEAISDVDTQLFRNIKRLRKEFKEATDIPEQLMNFAKIYDVKLEIKKGYFENTLAKAFLLYPY